MLSTEFAAAARQTIDSKTKPPGSLGQLERWAVQISCLQGTLEPRVDRARILVFGADHGLSRAGVSAFPREVTVEMMHNFARGGAAINVLTRSAGLEVEVIDVGVDGDLGGLEGIVHAKVRLSSRDMRHEPAMTESELEAAWAAGVAATHRARDAGCRAIGIGEMGIGNTAASAALLSALTAEPAEVTVGRGSGIDDAGLEHKRTVIREVLATHAASTADPRTALATFGGLELAAMAGAASAAVREGMAVMVDGFISTVAALAATRIDPNIRPGLFFAHRSAEQGHQVALRALAADPLFDLGLRLGEGTGSALALPVLESAAAVMREMATFESAGVSGKVETEPEAPSTP